MRNLRVIITALVACSIAACLLSGCNKGDSGAPKTDNTTQRATKRDGT